MKPMLSEMRQCFALSVFSYFANKTIGKQGPINLPSFLLLVFNALFSSSN